MHITIFLFVFMCYETDASKILNDQSSLENKDDVDSIRLEMEALKSALLETIEVNHFLKQKVDVLTIQTHNIQNDYKKLKKQVRILSQQNDQLHRYMAMLMKQVHQCNENGHSDQELKGTKSQYTESRQSPEKSETAIDSQNMSTSHFQRATRDVPTGPTVAFAVMFYNGGTLRLGEHQVIEYNMIQTNIGNGFNVHHSHFIAPVNGLYLLSFTCMDYDSYLYLEMVKNGETISAVYCSNKATAAIGSHTTVQTLNKNDVVWVRSTYNQDALSVLNGSGYYNSFMGVLLFRDL